MGVGISYMGTKRELAGAVSEVVASCQDGAVLDAFSGMCSVGEEIGERRQVWTNDVQIFASAVGAALFTSKSAPPRSQFVADRYHCAFRAEMEPRETCLQYALQTEVELTDAATFDAFEAKRLLLKEGISAAPIVVGAKHNLFQTLYADTFIGLRQALEIDSIIACIRQQEKSADDETNRWFLIALGRALLRVSNSTGHFAQYLKPKANTFRSFQRLRRRRLWDEWLASIDELSPVGTAQWRRQNKSFNRDTLELLPALAEADERPSIVYADPPYTNDQYSRFYHLLETIFLYDYPLVSGAGLYRPDRFVTPFSLKAQSGISLEKLIRSVKRIGADFILSYPTNGLAHEKGIDPKVLMARHFSHVEVCHAISHGHSTFGASKGIAKSHVTEMIYLGRS